MSSEEESPYKAASGMANINSKILLRKQVRWNFEKEPKPLANAV